MCSPGRSPCFSIINRRCAMKKNNGYILIVTLLVMASMLVIGLAYANYYRQDKSLALRGENDHIAAAAADAGIQDSLYQLKRNPGWAAGFANVTLPHAGSAYTVTFDQSQKTFPYSTNNSTGSGTVTGYEGRSVPAGTVYIISTGIYAKSKKIEHALITTQSSLFQNAVLTQQKIHLNGNVITDSYNSSIASYSAQHQNSGGNLQTNSGSGGIVELDGRVNVMGNITVGPGGAASTSLNVHGGSTYQSASVAASPVTLPAMNPTLGPNKGDVSTSGTLTPGTYRNLNLRGNLQLQAGTYIFTGDIDLSGQASILLPTTGNQKVTIYVLGKVEITGNSSINGNTKLPTNLTIYGGPKTEKFEISGLGGQSQGLYFALYAPYTEFEISGNAEIFGSVISDTFEMSGNGALHFDNALKTQGTSGAISVKSLW